jgi:hypothetical protein
MTPLRCPHCAAPLDIDPACVIEEPMLAGYHVNGDPVPRRRRIAPAALCTGCEFCIEITTFPS